VLVEDCFVGRARTACRGVVHLEPGQRDLEVNYSGLSLVRGKQVRFRYRLDNYDPQWVEADRRRTAYYPQLPPGEYVFRVKAGHAEGLWSEEEAQLRVVVKPSFHETGWFAALLLVCVGGVIRLLWRWRLRKLEAEKKTQQEFSRGLIETQEKERQRIARELHDSIGQSLLLIQNRAVMGLTAGEVEPDLREQLEAIAGTAKASIEEVRQIAADLRPAHLERLGLKQAIEAMVETAQKASEVKFHCDVEDVGDVFTPEEQILVFRVLQEAVSNVLKHAYAREAWVKLRREGRRIELEVGDDGAGISLAAGRRTGMGLKGITERVTMLRGQYHVETAPGAGCRIKIRINR
jgi:signal transduction histidine kinase